MCRNIKNLKRKNKEEIYFFIWYTFNFRSMQVEIESINIASNKHEHPLYYLIILHKNLGISLHSINRSVDSDAILESVS